MCVIGTGWMNSMYGLLAACVIFPGSVDVDGLALLPVSDGESFHTRK